MFSVFERVTINSILIMALADYEQNGTSLEDRNVKVIFTSHTQYICSLVSVKQNYQQLISQIPKVQRYWQNQEKFRSERHYTYKLFGQNDFFFFKCKVQHFPKGKAKIQLELPFSEMWQKIYNTDFMELLSISLWRINTSHGSTEHNFACDCYLKNMPKAYIEQGRFRQLFLLACSFVCLKIKNKQQKNHAPLMPTKKRKN